MDSSSEKSRDKGEESVREAVFDAFIASLEAQARALRRLRSAPDTERRKRKRKGMSQVDMVYDVLSKAPRGLHVTELIERVEKGHGVRLDRESIVSALSKKIARGQRFVRVGKNTFAVKKGER